LADLFNSLKETGLASEKVASKAKEYPMPANCNLEIKQANLEIWTNVINTKDMNTDIQIQKSQKLVFKASHAILKIADSAIKANKSKKERKRLSKIFSNMPQMHLPSQQHRMCILKNDVGI